MVRLIVWIIDLLLTGRAKRWWYKRLRGYFIRSYAIRKVYLEFRDSERAHWSGHYYIIEVRAGYKWYVSDLIGRKLNTRQEMIKLGLVNLAPVAANMVQACQDMWYILGQSSRNEWWEVTAINEHGVTVSEFSLSLDKDQLQKQIDELDQHFINSLS